MSMHFPLFLFLKISRAICITCFHPCSKCFSFVSGVGDDMCCYWVKPLKKGKWLRVRWEAWESSPGFPSWLQQGCVMWCCSAYTELRICRSCTLHNCDQVLQRVTSCWLYVPTQTDFGFHLVAFWRTVWKWWHSRLSVPQVTEYTGMVPLLLTTQMCHRWGSSESSSFLQMSVERNRHFLANIANKLWV